MTTYDLVIKDGIVVDGAGNPRQRTDVAISGSHIAHVGRVDASDAARVIDASGLVVAPGFIDLHTHYDAQVYWDPYLTTSGWHGVTSVITGNCGFGFAPVDPTLRERAMLSMTAVEAIPIETLQDALPWDWVSFPEHLDSLDRADKAVNVLPYVPLNPLLIWVLGLDAAKAGKRPTDVEHAELARLLDEALAAGACGWSAQCLGEPGQPDARLPQGDHDGTPMPTDVMWPETRARLADVLGQRGQGFMQASGVPFDECEALVERSGRPLIWQAVVANDKTKIYQKVLAWLADTRARGLPIYGQAMTTDAPLIFTLADENVLDRSPLGRVHRAGDRAAKMTVLADPSFRAEMAEHPMTVFSELADMTLVAAAGGAPASAEGRRLGDLAAERGVRPIDVLCDVAIDSDLTATFGTQQFQATLAGLKELVDDPYLIPGLSDGGAHLSFLSSGCYGTEYIARYVRDHEFTTLEQAHWRLSGLTAHCAGFTDRGVLRAGAAADIVVYDYDTLDYLPPRFVSDLPGGHTRSVIGATGYRHILVNGQVTIEDDTETGAMAGQVLRHGQGA